MKTRKLRVLISQGDDLSPKFSAGVNERRSCHRAGGRSRPAAAAAGSLTSLTYSGQRWGLVQEGMAPAFTKATGIDAKIITFPISQGYARILNALGVGSTEYDVIDLDYGILAQIANKLTPSTTILSKDPAYKADYEKSVSANVRGLYQFDGSRLGKGTTYGIANDGNTQLGFYRTDIFEKAGIKAPPATWDEALDVAKELTVSTPSGKQYGFTTNGKRGIFSSTLFGQVLFSYGGELARREQRSDSDHSGGGSRIEYDRKTDEVRRPERRQRRRQRDDQCDGFGGRGLYSECVGQ